MTMTESIMFGISGGRLSRDEDGNFPAWAWPGGYPITYYTRDGMTVCAECASRETDPWQEAEAADVYYEGPTIQCDDCGCEIESAYGDPDDPDDD
jgi:hypothetical protein